MPDLTLLNIEIGQLAKSDPLAIHRILRSVNLETFKKNNNLHPRLLKIMELTDSLRKDDHRTMEYSFRPHMHQPQGTHTNNNKFSTSPLRKKKKKSVKSVKDALLRPGPSKSRSSSPGEVSMEDLPPPPPLELLPKALDFPKGSCVKCVTLGEEDYCHRIIYLDECDIEGLKDCVLTCTDQVEDRLLPMVCLSDLLYKC